MEILQIVQSLFPMVWSFFSDLTFPGLGVSFGVVFIAVIIIRLSIALYYRATGSGGSDYRSDSSNNPKISENRRGDEF